LGSKVRGWVGRRERVWSECLPFRNECELASRGELAVYMVVSHHSSGNGKGF
jgi:hypothetical protein